MSVPVALDAVQSESARFETSPLLVTVSSDGSPRIASVLVTFDGGKLLMGAGRSARANVAERPAVTVVWAAAAGGDFCMIIDGVAHVGAGETLVIEPTSAVLHRVASETP